MLDCYYLDTFIEPLEFASLSKGYMEGKRLKKKNTIHVEEPDIES